MDDDILYVGPCPAEEDAVQIGEPDYAQRAKTQCRAFIEAIRKTLGQEPEGARLSVASQPHDFGSYYEVVVRFDPEDREAAEYAYRVEAKAPTTWTDAGMEPPDLSRGRRID
jgi:hypothetical protein